MNTLLKDAPFITDLEEKSSVKPFLYSILFALSYIIFCSVYIWLSGKFASKLSENLAQLENIELIKGLIFVFVTGSALFIFLFFNFRRIKRKNETIVRQNRDAMTAERLTTVALFSSAVIHDINNLLSVIDGNAQLLRMSKVNNNQEEAGYLDSITEAIRTLNTLMNSILRAGKEYVPQEKEYTDINSAIMETSGFARKHEKVKNCRLSCNAEGKIGLNLNRNLFGRTLMNLILNAAEATDDKGEIIIRSMKDEKNVILEVHDNGPGISEKIKNRIMEPFFTTKVNGTGLGLLSLRMFLKQHNGNVEIKRSELGGACFHIMIPVA